MRYRAVCVLTGVVVLLVGMCGAGELTAQKRAPIPDSAAQESSRKALAEVYSVRFKDAQTDTAKSALAKELVAAAEDVPDGSSDQFVLLKIGCSIAADAGDAATVVAAVRGLEKDFDMPLAKLAAESLLTAAGRTSGYSRHKDVAHAAMFVADLVGNAGDYEMALQLCEVGQSSAKQARQHELEDKLLAKVDELKREQKEFQKYQEAVARLKREPHEPGANLAAGRYLCFVIGDWDEGLTLLAAGADAELKSAAIKDLKGGTLAEEQLAIGDVWWDLAEKETVLPKERFQERAAVWYSVALPGLTGLARAKAAKRLLEVPAVRVPEVPGTLTNSIGMKFVPIPAGEFSMGEADGDYNERPHRVHITRPFYLGMYEVTQAEYVLVMGTNPSHFKGGGDRLPVESVSWEDAQDFCRKLSRLPDEQLVSAVYRLPTEAEWEYACRAGTASRYGFDDSRESLADYAWFSPNARSRTNPVGQLKPNAWGLYDMHGNVREWCADWYDPMYYSSSPKDDPTGPAQGSERVMRDIPCASGEGPSFRASYRHMGLPGSRDKYVGFRVARSSD